MIDTVEQKVGLALFDYQREFLEAALANPVKFRACLFFKTGAGKSLTALAAMAVLGHDSCVVIAPPATHAQWQDLALRLGVKVATMSHAMFRQKTTKVSRTVPIIADEMHLLGGQRGRGWRKLDKIAAHIDAPIILCSATPNYNDAERCYCVQHILNPHETKGGYLQFIYQHCTTEQNPFGMQPIVTGFHKYPDAAAFLSDMDGVFYIPDDAQFAIDDLLYASLLPSELEKYGYDRRNHKMVASQMEMRHTVRFQELVGDDGSLLPHMETLLTDQLEDGPTLVYANHATVAEAINKSLLSLGFKPALVTGSTQKATKELIIKEFLNGKHQVLIGTATLATGTDGMDRVCDTLVIVDDTDDDALRRQLIGRILPRGDYETHVEKRIVRFVSAL